MNSLLHGGRKTKKVVLCVPTLTRPMPQTLASIEASIPLLDAAGWDHAMVSEIGCPYISGARATMLRKALDAQRRHAKGARRWVHQGYSRTGRVFEGHQGRCSTVYGGISAPLLRPAIRTQHRPV